ncbi:Oxidoreductase PigB, partial [Dissostichus eleginoides]
LPVTLEAALLAPTIDTGDAFIIGGGAIGMQGPGCFSEPDKSYLQRSSTGVLCHRSVIRRLCGDCSPAALRQVAEEHLHTIFTLNNGPVLGDRQQKLGPRVTGKHNVDHA